jgi:hypothetical protein
MGPPPVVPPSSSLPGTATFVGAIVVDRRGGVGVVVGSSSAGAARLRHSHDAANYQSQRLLLVIVVVDPGGRRGWVGHFSVNPRYVKCCCVHLLQLLVSEIWYIFLQLQIGPTDLFVVVPRKMMPYIIFETTYLEYYSSPSSDTMFSKRISEYVRSRKK